ncbi:tetratricopeptide repeat protein [Myroides fluvii]|uniref:tetratricopeptide repeat protein n=1 Tax=Myroides fluvii TaxID=2572594 RepID=UPI00131E303D|nr:tetratricopeptide repeat protein [Myroides fluvii]
MKKYVIVLCLSLFSLVAVQAQNQLEELVKEGIAYHDNGQYEKAIESYQKMLELDPNSSIAYYEIGMSYMYAKQYDLALEYSNKAIERGGRYTVPAIVVKASTLSNQNRVQEAIELLEDTIEKYEADVMVYYNLAICYFKLNNLDGAERALVAGIYDNPLHASSHYMLAVLKESQQLRIESMLSAYFFLLLDQHSARSVKMLQLIEQSFAHGVTVSTEEKNVVNLTIPKGSLEADSKYGMVEMGLVLNAAANFELKIGQDIQGFCDRTTNFLGLLQGVKTENPASMLELDLVFYVPFFNAIREKDVFCNYIYQMTPGGNKQWLDKNEKKVESFQQWMQEWIQEKASELEQQVEEK